MAGALLTSDGEVLLGEGGDALFGEYPTTRLGSAGYGVKRAGDFGSKSGTDGPHTVGRITRLGSAGYGVRRCGSFAGKSAGGSDHPVGKITRLGSSGYGVRRCGSFAGKTSDAIIVEPTVPPDVGGVGRLSRGGGRKRPGVSPAFPQHLYRPLRPEPPPEPEVSIEPPKKAEIKLGPSPLLPMVGELGIGPVTADLKAILLKQAEEFRDDEDALIAILLALE